jgi:hypothetical protein
VTHRLNAIRLSPTAAFWALAALALLVSHDMIWLAQLTPGQGLAGALRATGHGYWAWVSLGIVLVGVVSAAVTLLALVRLRRRASVLGARSRASGYARRALVTWLRLLGIVAVAFAIQENAEHFVLHTHLPGLGALVGPEYPLAIPVIGLISAIAAVVAAAMRTIERGLVAAIAAALAASRRRAPRRQRVAHLDPTAPRPSPLARAGAGRAPPPLLAPIH